MSDKWTVHGPTGRREAIGLVSEESPHVPGGGLLIVRAGEAITSFDGESWSSVSNAGILVRGNLIDEVGDYDALIAEHPQARVVGSRDHIAMPGLINAHHHGLGVSGFQLGAVDGPLESWMGRFYASLRRMSDPYLDTLVSDIQLLRSGVTSVAQVGIVRRSDSEISETLRGHRASGIRARYAVNFTDRFSWVYESDESFTGRLPGELQQMLLALDGPQDDVATRLDLFDQLLSGGDERVTVMLAAEGPEWCSDELLLAVRERASAAGVPLHIHALESPMQRHAMDRLYNGSGIAHLADIGFIAADTTLAHCVWMTRREMELVAAHDATVVHNPSSNLRLRCGIAPVHEMRAAGVRVAIGSDSNSFADRDDYFHELRMARLLSNLPSPSVSQKNSPALSADETLAASLVSGGRALGLEGRIGELSPGRYADIVLLSKAQVDGVYCHRDVGVVERCLTRGERGAVDAVVVAGEVVMEDGELISLKEDEVLEAARAAVIEDTVASAWTEAASLLQQHVDEFYADWTVSPGAASYAVNAIG